MYTYAHKLYTYIPIAIMYRNNKYQDSTKTSINGEKTVR